MKEDLMTAAANHKEHALHERIWKRKAIPAKEREKPEYEYFGIGVEPLS